jgi:flagellar biosynthesis/type III secretory pathway chaperone
MASKSEGLSGLLCELQQVLEEERSILLSGHPQRIARAVERKLRLAQEIEIAWTEAGTARPHRDTVVRLNGLNRGNAVICSAVLRQLTRTLDQLRQHECHRSYRPDGGETSPSAMGRLGAA